MSGSPIGISYETSIQAGLLNAANAGFAGYKITTKFRDASAFDELRPDPLLVDQMFRQKRERARLPEKTQLEILRRLACAAECFNGDTDRHPQRVGDLAASIGSALGFAERRVELIRTAASLHDIGKLGIPANILLKPAKLTAEEYETIKTHTTVGAGILSGSRHLSLQLAETVARYHHERWDGSGYWGFHAELIPVEARIVSIADTFDVLTHRRPYKQAWPVCDAVAEINAQSGRQFDPQLVDVFTSRFRSGGLPAMLNPAGNG
jgi:putative two-component system response regulator